MASPQWTYAGAFRSGEVHVRSATNMLGIVQQVLGAVAEYGLEQTVSSFRKRSDDDSEEEPSSIQLRH